MAKGEKCVFHTVLRLAEAAAGGHGNAVKNLFSIREEDLGVQIDG